MKRSVLRRNNYSNIVVLRNNAVRGVLRKNVVQTLRTRQSSAKGFGKRVFHQMQLGLSWMRRGVSSMLSVMSTSPKRSPAA